MKKVVVFFYLFCLAFSFHVNAQEDSIAVLSSNLLEDLLENNDEQTYDFYTLYDELQDYLRNPLNINKASQEDFESLQLLSDIQINEILSYRDNFGPFLSKYELQTIPSLDFGTLSALIPLVTEGGERKNFTLKSLLDESTQTLFLKHKRVLQDRKGFLEDSYLGDPNHFFARYNFSSGRNVRAALTMEKDPGEEFFSGSNKYGFDYYSGFVYLRDINNLFESINIGDYSISMGQGLIVHNSFGGGKSSFVTNVKRGGRIIRPYSSVNEANFFRGISTTLNLSDHWKFTVFGSRKNIDGSVVQDSVIETGFERISAIRIDGFHRTDSEIENENSTTQTSWGSVLQYKRYNLNVGLNILQQNFSSTLEGRDDLYRKYSFSGNQLTNASLDWSYRYKNINTFGEYAQSDNGGQAFLAGFLTTLSRNLDFVFVHRNYGKDYQVLNGNAFSESTLPINEIGNYIGLKLNVNKAITLSSYIDYWKHPWLRFLKDAPSIGRELLFKAEYYKKRKLTAYLQYRFEEKQQNGQGDKIDPLVFTGQHRARLHLAYKLNKDLELRNRIETVHYKEDDTWSNGFLLYQDIIYKPFGKNYSFTARYSVFDTDGFDTRIYTYENDILYEFSIPFYADQGYRFYINWRQRIGRHITLEVRYARTYYRNRETIGSAGQLIDGNIFSEVKTQLKYRF